MHPVQDFFDDLLLGKMFTGNAVIEKMQSKDITHQAQLTDILIGHFLNKIDLAPHSMEEQRQFPA